MDASGVVALGRRLHALADEVRGIASTTAAQGSVAWESLSAQRFRARLDEECARLRSCAAAVDAAADAVQAHAAAVARGWLW